jgi:predicted transcriptional regulator
MGDAAVILDDDVRTALDEMAERYGRTPSDLANDALRARARYEAALLASIAEGEAQLERGEGVSTAELVDELRRARAR